MAHAVKLLVSLTVLMALFSCSATYESKGNAAYKAAQSAKDSDAQRRLQKEAYMLFHRAVKAHPERINNRLRNRFTEMTLVRAEMVLSEGSVNMDALPLFMDEIDSMLTGDVEPALRGRYAAFLMLMADSNINNSKIYKGMAFIDKALAIAADKGEVQRKKDGIVGNMAKENFEIAEAEYKNGVENKDNEALIRAEYQAKLALYYNNEYPGAKELLSKLYEINRSCYSAYKAVITDRPDTAIFRSVDRFDILFAIPTIKGSTYTVDMYNYSYNPLRLRPSDFYLVDESGNRYPAAASSKIAKEILEQEHEIRLTLNFPSVKGKAQKLVYETPNKDHYTEKYFF
jgi:tetratricopeptide (TPR) repeat protein